MKNMTSGEILLGICLGVLLFVFGLSTIGCEGLKELEKSAQKAEQRREQETKQLAETQGQRFRLVEWQEFTDWETIKIIQDTKTGQEYLMVIKPEGIGVCPLINLISGKR